MLISGQQLTDKLSVDWNLVNREIIDMQNVKDIQRDWRATFASLVPLWLLSFSIMAEGFPKLPIPIGLAIASFVLAILASIMLLWKRWMRIELILYSLFPFVMLFLFDEISTTYKSPFIVLSSLVLSVGIIGYQRCRLTWSGWLFLLTVAVVTWIMAAHAANSFWEMAADLGYQECFPDVQGCAPLSSRGTPWWVLFFS